MTNWINTTGLPYTVKDIIYEFYDSRTILNLIDALAGTSYSDAIAECKSQQKEDYFIEDNVKVLRDTYDRSIAILNQRPNTNQNNLVKFEGMKIF